MVSTISRASDSFFSRRIFFSGIAVLGAALVLSLGACHPTVTDPKDPNFIVAEQKDWTITRAQLTDEINGFLKLRGKTVKDVDPSKVPMLETQVLNNMVIKKLIFARAATLNLKDVDKDDDATFAQLKGQFPTEADLEAKLKSVGLTVPDVKQQIHEGTVIRKTLEAEAFQGIDPSDAEINAFYMQNQDKLTTPEKVRVSRVVIMVDEKATPSDRAAKMKAIQKARARVMKGEDFAKVATEVSEDRYSAPKGGDVGYSQRGENDPVFDKVAFSTKPGVVSEVFESPTGLEFLKVTDVHPGGVVPIAQARDTIAKYLRQSKQREAMDAYAKKLLADSGVTIHLKNVDPIVIPAPGGAPATSQEMAPPQAGASAPPTDASAPASPTDTPAPATTNPGQ